MDRKEKKTTLKQLSEQFVKEKTYKGGRRPKRIYFWSRFKHFYFCKRHNLVGLQGQKSKKNGYLRIQGRMQIFEKNVPEGFKSRFDRLER